MKALEGITLGDLLSVAQQEIAEEKQKGVVSLLKQKLNILNQTNERISNLQKDLEKQMKVKSDLETLFLKVEEGKWDVINLSEKQAEEKTESK